MSNGKLLAAAAANGFDVLLTGDQNISYQQNLNALPLAVWVLIAPNNKLESFMPLVPKLLDLLQQPAISRVESIRLM